MAAIVTTLVNVFTSLFGLLGRLWDLSTQWTHVIWDAFIAVFDLLLAGLLLIVVFLFDFSAQSLLFLLEMSVNLLPEMPPAPQIGGMSNFVLQANRYVPIAEISAMMGVWSSIFMTIGTAKLAKFMRGAG